MLFHDVNMRKLCVKDCLLVVDELYTLHSILLEQKSCHKKHDVALAMTGGQLEDHTILLFVESLGNDKRCSNLPLGWLLNASSKDAQRLVQMLRIRTKCSAIL